LWIVGKTADMPFLWLDLLEADIPVPSAERFFVMGQLDPNNQAARQALDFSLN
jgi:hypothetical protein